MQKEVIWNNDVQNLNTKKGCPQKQFANNCLERLFAIFANNDPKRKFAIFAKKK